MSKRPPFRKKTPPKKRGAVASPLRRRALTVLGVMGLGAGLASLGLFGKNFLQPFKGNTARLFKSSTARPLYLEGERLKSKGHPLYLVEGWILSEQDLYPHKKK